MGRKDSSSKAKSSKRKRDKISSKKKSRRKDRKKHRISDSVSTNSVDDLLNSSPTLKSDHRKKITKKRRPRREPSLSSYSDSESSSSDSDSGADSTYKSRKPLKGTKKARRKRSTSPSGGIARKRKRLRRDRSVKKNLKKKVSKYSNSSSSLDSDSQSSSGGSAADDKLRLRGRSSHRGKKTKTPSSSCDRDTEPIVSIINCDEQSFTTNNSKRLKSVIVVLNQSRSHDEENRWEMGREAIVYDQNDLRFRKSVEINECAEKNAVEEVSELGKSRIDTCDHELEGVRTNEVKETDVFVPKACSEGDVLESILRQKALERLRKFQQRLQNDSKSTTVKRNDESDVGIVIVEPNMPEISKTSVLPPKETEDEDKKVPDSEHFEKDTGMATQSIDHPPKEDKKLVECSESSSVGPILKERSLETGKEVSDGFQEKTMSVMRGGEQVQVSYKVYIPKKAPALARRQLKR